MSQFKHSKSGATVTGFVIMSMIILALPLAASAQDMTVSPHRIVLNAVGQTQSIQTIIRTPMEEGFTLTDYSLVLKFDGVTVGEAYDLFYCVADANFLARFDRAAILANPEVQAMANTTVTATVEGWYTAEDADGNTYTADLVGSAPVQIYKPGKVVRVKIATQNRVCVR